jgi:hypothetical protein
MKATLWKLQPEPAQGPPRDRAREGQEGPSDALAALEFLPKRATDPIKKLIAERGRER